MVVFVRLDYVILKLILYGVADMCCRWTHVVQIETVYYDVLLFICYYIYKIILLFWAVWV